MHRYAMLCKRPSTDALTVSKKSHLVCNTLTLLPQSKKKKKDFLKILLQPAMKIDTR